ncbi:MAG: hypothetical protein EZS28_038538 [Streblomastix strix]|uniref:Uncharacterized protein n=1 Tax=Streblomastix strix TaxID=222440 RepID=A0A5J4U545_9EUKA|nr:MAG: hypothetical protein EZS28_038538 [Streblomastix strix]
MNPKYEGKLLNRILTQFILIQAGILAMEHVNNKMNFWKTLKTSLNIQKLDHLAKSVRNIPKENITGVRKTLDSHLGPLFSQQNYLGPPGMALDQSNTKLRSTQLTSRRLKIVPLIQTNSQSQTIPYPNLNQSSILNVDFMRMFTNPFSVLKGILHQQIAGDTAQVHHAPRGTFSINGNVRKVASPTDSIASGQAGVAGTKPINIQTVSSTQLQGNPVREPKVEKKGRKTPVGSKATSTNISVVVNQNQSEDQQR